MVVEINRPLQKRGVGDIDLVRGSWGAAIGHSSEVARINYRLPLACCDAAPVICVTRKRPDLAWCLLRCS